jgi:hypothetical protein
MSIGAIFPAFSLLLAPMNRKCTMPAKNRKSLSGTKTTLKTLLLFPCILPASGLLLVPMNRKMHHKMHHVRKKPQRPLWALSTTLLTSLPFLVISLLKAEMACKMS